MAAPPQNLNKTLTLCLHVCLLFWLAGFWSASVLLRVVRAEDGNRIIRFGAETGIILLVLVVD